MCSWCLNIWVYGPKDDVNVSSEVFVRGEFSDSRNIFRALFQNIIIIFYHVLATPSLIFALSPDATSAGNKF